MKNIMKHSLIARTLICILAAFTASSKTFVLKNGNFADGKKAGIRI